MNVLVGCEESQKITIAFRELGHEAYSCDIQECSGGHPEWHIKDDLLKHLNDGWDLMIAHPPCTYLSYAAMHVWNAPGRLEKRLDALAFFGKLWTAPIDKVCLENPKGCASPTIAKYSQEIQPYFWGDGYLKTTWLWLKNLPALQYKLHDDLFGLRTASDFPEPVYATQRKDGSVKLRHFAEARHGGKQRSKTFSGIAKAMAEQWGSIDI